MVADAPGDRIGGPFPGDCGAVAFRHCLLPIGAPACGADCPIARWIANGPNPPIDMPRESCEKGELFEKGIGK